MRTELRNEPIIDDVVKLFFKALQIAGSTLPPVFDKLDSSGLYYLLLIRQRLHQLALLDDGKTRGISVASDRFKLRRGFARSTPRDVLRIVQGWRQDPIEAREVLRILF
jgi:hypothetical protein